MHQQVLICGLPVAEGKSMAEAHTQIALLTNMVADQDRKLTNAHKVLSTLQALAFAPAHDLQLACQELFSIRQA